MIYNTPCPINLHDGFCPPQREKIKAIQVVQWLFCNVISAGIYGVVKNLWKAYEIKKMEAKQQDLQALAAKLKDKWEALDAQVASLSQIPPDQIGAKLQELHREKDALQAFYQAELQVAKCRAITLFAVPYIQFVGQLVWNVLSLGVVSLVLDRTLSHQKAVAEAQNDYIKTAIQKQVERRSHRFEEQITEFQQVQDLKQREKEALQTEAGQAFVAKRQANQELQTISAELKKIERQLIALQAQQVSLQDIKGKKETSAQQGQAEIERLREDCKQLEQRCQNFDEAEFVHLQQEHELLKNKVDSLQTHFDREHKLKIKLKGLQQTEEGSPELQRLLSQLGPIPPKYTKQIDDGEIAGEAGIDHQLGNWSHYAKRYNDKETAADIIKASFDFAFDELIKMGLQSPAKIHFNDSSHIRTNPEYRENQLAVYAFMAYDLLKGAKLKKIDKDRYALQLNNKGILMGSSCPERVKSYGIDASGQRFVKTQILFKHSDEFTPPFGNHKDLLLGIDPVSAKWIIARLSAEEKGHLFNLLMDFLIPADHPEWLATQAFMNQENNERVALVRTAYELIYDLAQAIDKKFVKQGVLLAQWSAKAPNDAIIPILLKPERRGNKSSPPDMADPHQTSDQPLVEWTPDWDSIKPSETSLFFSSNHCFSKLVEGSISRYKLIYANLSKEVVGNTKNICYYAKYADEEIDRVTIKGINHQYWWSHQMVNPHGCLFSSLLTLLVAPQRSELQPCHVQALKNALAKFLGKPENNQRFAGKIKSTYKLEVAQYQCWLRGEMEYPDTNTYNLGNVEIELVACLMGVRIGVLYPEVPTKLDAYGLTVPDGNIYYFGPNTKEVLFLYNLAGNTYWSLWPKWNADQFKSEEAKRACQEINDYAVAISRNH